MIPKSVKRFSDKIIAMTIPAVIILNQLHGKLNPEIL